MLTNLTKHRVRIISIETLGAIMTDSKQVRLI